MNLSRLVAPALAALFVTSAALGDADHPHGGKSDGHEHATATDHKHAAVTAHWTAPAEAARRPNPVAATEASIRRGEKLYNQYCASCHGPKGRGDGPAGAALNPRPADLAAMAPQHADGGLAWKIAEGRGAMPPWKGTLGENQIWDVVNYLKKGLPAPQKGYPHGQHKH